MNRITEEQMRRETAQEVGINVPKGVSPVGYLREFLGTLDNAHDEMPSDLDVEDTVIVNFK